MHAKYLILIGLLAVTVAQGGDWLPQEPYRVVLQVKDGALPGPHSVVKAQVNFTALMGALGSKEPFNQYSLRVESLNGATPGQSLPFRFDHQFNTSNLSYESAGQIVLTVPDPKTTKFAVYFGPKGELPDKAAPVPLIGDGDLLRIAGGGQNTLLAPACYPCFVDFDGDGRRDIVGSDRYGTGARVTWFRNVGTNTAPVFSEREIFHLQTNDGKDISNPNRGWMLTVALCDWDGDGKRDLLVGGWCRYLTFYRNLGTKERPVFAPGKVIFDAKVFPGLDYGPDPNTPYQGVFIEPCDWDGDGDLDLLCGTYTRSHIYLLPNTGRGPEGLPVLGAPVALEAGGKEIDFLGHSKPSVGDWDGDGDLDLMSGQCYTEACPNGKVAGCYYFENVSDAKHPKLAEGIQLRDADGRLISAGFHSQATMLDWNKDGKQDVLVTGAEGANLYLNTGTAKSPRLVHTAIPCNGLAPCRVGDFAYPLAYDLDRDGTLDIVVGNGEGNVLFFKGVKGLQYESPVKVKSEGKEIDEVGCPDGGEVHRGYVKVAIADWNADGHPDLTMWSNNGMEGWQTGTLKGWCLKFFPGTADPMNFGPPVEIKAADQHIKTGYRCKPDVVDLDGDGLLDLVVACGHSKVNADDDCTMMFFKNIGSKNLWELAAPVPMTMSDGRSLVVQVRTATRLVDWDGDGDLDLFTGNHSSLSVRYWENVGTKTKPIFAAPKPLDVVNEAHKSHHEVGVDAVDLDCDGTLDLVVGSGDSGMIHFFRRAFLERQPMAEVVAAESKK